MSNIKCLKVECGKVATDAQIKKRGKTKMSNVKCLKFECGKVATYAQI
jgi:hypothetical protein